MKTTVNNTQPSEIAESENAAAKPDTPNRGNVVKFEKAANPDEKASGGPKKLSEAVDENKNVTVTRDGKTETVDMKASLQEKSRESDEDFSKFLNDSFGTNIDSNKDKQVIAKLKEDLGKDDWDWEGAPTVETGKLGSGAGQNGPRGAFVTGDGESTIVMDESLGGDQQARIFWEEFGHAIDHRLRSDLNASRPASEKVSDDAPGDEGAIFVKNITGEKVTGAERTEDDSGKIFLPGKGVFDAEFNVTSSGASGPTHQAYQAGFNGTGGVGATGADGKPNPLYQHYLRGQQDAQTEPVTPPQHSALLEPGETEAGETGFSVDDIKRRFTGALQNTKGFFATETVSALPDGSSGPLAAEVFEANTENTLSKMDAAGYHAQELMNAYNDGKAAGLTLSSGEKAEFDMVAEAYSGFMTKLSGQMASEALNMTKQVANDTALEANANEAHNKARAFGIAANVMSFAATPGSLKDVVDGVGKGAVDGTRAAVDLANAGLGASRGAWLTDQLKPAVSGGGIADPASEDMLGWGDKIAGQLGGFNKFLSDEGFSTASSSVTKANDFASEIMKRSTQEVFAVGTLADLRQNHTTLGASGSDERRFNNIVRDGEEGPADRFAARDLEEIGYLTQVTNHTAGGDSIYKDDGDPWGTSGEKVYTKVGDANNFFISNRNDGDNGLPSAGLSIWDNALDVSVNKQLDRIDDRWNTPDHSQQMEDTLKWIASVTGFKIDTTLL